MNCPKSIKRFFSLFLCTSFFGSTAIGAENLPHPDTYLPKAAEVDKLKRFEDDPKDLVATLPLNEVVPPEIWDLLVSDTEEAKRLTEELVGFRSPDVVGKIAPEIKPGKYTYNDLEQYFGLKELFPPEMLRYIKQGGPPLVGSIPDFEIIPTTQLYWYLRLCEYTKQNLGRAKLDKDGYLVPDSWEVGFPFPRPSGSFKAQEVFYSFDKRFKTFDLCYWNGGGGKGFDRNLVLDKNSLYDAYGTKFKGLTLFPPYGWFDERAKRNKEYEARSIVVHEPRANRGTVMLRYFYDETAKMDSSMIYVPSLRRIRKMAATDTQDPLGDMTYDDDNHLYQKITPIKYPYKFDIIAEREYLMPISVDQAKGYLDSKNGYAARGISFMRRPCYVLQMTQLDPNYVYSKRMLYIDKENFMICFSANYDQRGRLYRSQLYTYCFMTDVAQEFPYGMPLFQFDHIDLHSTCQMMVPLPAVFTREYFSIQAMIKRGK